MDCSLHCNTHKMFRNGMRTTSIVTVKNYKFVWPHTQTAATVSGDFHYHLIAMHNELYYNFSTSVLGWDPGHPVTLKYLYKWRQMGTSRAIPGGIVPRDVIFIGTLKLPGHQDFALRKLIYVPHFSVIIDWLLPRTLHNLLHV